MISPLLRPKGPLKLGGGVCLERLLTSHQVLWWQHLTRFKRKGCGPWSQCVADTKHLSSKTSCSDNHSIPQTDEHPTWLLITDALRQQCRRRRLQLAPVGAQQAQHLPQHAQRGGVPALG